MAENKGLLKGFQVDPTKSKFPIYFADNMLILLEGEENNVMVVKSLVKCFELVSSFKVN